MDKITSVSQAIMVLKKLQKSNDIGQKENEEKGYKFPFGIFFRGQTNKNWELIPGIFRPIKKNQALLSGN